MQKIQHNMSNLEKRCWIKTASSIVGSFAYCTPDQLSMGTEGNLHGVRI